MNKKIAFAFAFALTGCGGGGGGNNETSSSLLGDTDVFNPEGPIVNACASDYYTELVGDYDGQIVFEADDGSQSCQWEVELQIASSYISEPNMRRICDLTFNMASDSVSTEGCEDIGTGGTLFDTLVVPSSLELWTNTPWPVDAFAEMPSALPENAVFPVGIANTSTRQFTVVFDGLGNVTFPSVTDILPEWSGVLVKQ